MRVSECFSSGTVGENGSSLDVLREFASGIDCPDTSLVVSLVNMPSGLLKNAPPAIGRGPRGRRMMGVEASVIFSGPPDEDTGRLAI